jgi:hypothetical protein
MRVLEITGRLQGQRHDDYHWGHEGELAYIPGTVCDCPDCGCERGFVGMASRRPSTTAEVVDRPGLTIEVVANELASSLQAGGWMPEADPADPIVAELLEWLVRAVGDHPVGTVLELTRAEARPRFPLGDRAA